MSFHDLFLFFQVKPTNCILQCIRVYKFTGHMHRLRFLHMHLISPTHTAHTLTLTHTALTYHPQVSRIHQQMVWGGNMAESGSRASRQILTSWFRSVSQAFPPGRVKWVLTLKNIVSPDFSSQCLLELIPQKERGTENGSRTESLKTRIKKGREIKSIDVFPEEKSGRTSFSISELWGTVPKP